MKKFSIVVMALVCCASCTNRVKMETVVATKDTNGVVVCDRSLLKDTIEVKLSDLCEDLQMVKLEKIDTAFVPTGGVYVSDNYLLLDKSQQTPYKLFDKKTGKFLADIGSLGRGPGEYMMPCDKYIDEKAGRIYLLPWMSNQILVYDMSGKQLDPIRFPTLPDGQTIGISKGAFFFETSRGKVSIAQIPFRGAQVVAWTQTFGGEMLGSVAPGELSVQPDFSNEIVVGRNTEAFSLNIFTFGPRIDSLYHYDTDSYKLKPVFTMKFPGKMPIHTYAELPGYYIGEFSEPKRASATITVTQNQMFYIIDKNTLKGSFFKLKNDYLGNMEIGWPSYAFSNGYYTANWDPGDLLEDLEKALKDNEMSSSMRDKLTKLKDSISEKDNNYVFYAKLK